MRQSGFSGGAERWRAERESILDPIHSDGEILDIGCANGYLLECLVTWAKDRGINLTPHGLDHGARLID
jgi:2-polyprenyl-3-methyl-5-hydroxy-6-metoxy-1,4-benzoquinol methylase